MSVVCTSLLLLTLLLLVPRQTKLHQSCGPLLLDVFNTLIDYLREEYIEAGRMYRLPFTRHPQKIRFCRTCQLFRPPRASHCYYCNNCV